MALVAHARRGFVLALSLAACGGESQHQPSRSDTAMAGAAGAVAGSLAGGKAGQPGMIDSESGRPSEDGGAPTGGGGVGMVGGAPPGGAPSVPLINSGSRLCVDERDCLGLECVGAVGLTTLTCAVRCSNGDECTPDEACVESPLLEPICLHRCDSPTQCESSYDCFDALKSGDFVCVPPAWTVGWQ